MPALRYSVAFGMNEVIFRLQRVAISLLGERANFIFQSLCRRGQVRNNLLEHRTSGVLRRQQALDVFHHKNGRLVNLNYSQVLFVEKMLLILVKILIIGTPRPPRQGIRLARRATNKYPSLLTIQCSLDFSIDTVRIRLAKFQAPCLHSCVLESLSHSRNATEGGFIDLASYMTVVMSDLLGTAQAPEHRPQGQCSMCDFGLLNGKANLKERLLLMPLQGSKSFT